MCMVLYVAADAPLPEIPLAEPRRALSARPIVGEEEPVRAQFTKPHVYVLGAHEGCSCGFSYGVGDEDNDDAGRESVRQLGKYLAAAVEQVGPVELYACWVDDESEPPALREILTIRTFAGESEAFELPQRWFATVVAPAS